MSIKTPALMVLRKNNQMKTRGLKEVYWQESKRS
jgi:hypothetical protein